MSGEENDSSRKRMKLDEGREGQSVSQSDQRIQSATEVWKRCLKSSKHVRRGHHLLYEIRPSLPSYRSRLPPSLSPSLLPPCSPPQATPSSALEGISESNRQWEQQRRDWLQPAAGAAARAAPRGPPIMDLGHALDVLTNGKRFPKPVPLGELVDLLVEIWEGEGLGE
jgi:hypothetical protein